MATVKYIGEIRRLTNKTEEIVPASNVRCLLAYIKFQYGVTAYRAAKSGHIIVDGKSARFTTKLTENSHVQLLPVCGGG